MAKKSPHTKAKATQSAPARATTAQKKPAKDSGKPTKEELRERMEKAKRREARDAAPPPASREKSAAGLQLASSSHPERNSDFPKTYISEVRVSLDDPDHWVTLKWKGPKASSQNTGPFRSCPGAGVKGLNCDNETTSRRSGSMCTPKGTLLVSGFQRRLNSSPSATYVTWFMRARGIALHYYPSVPRYAASHGCVRLESERVARLIQDNSRIEVTKVTVSGTWTKPAKQY